MTADIIVTVLAALAMLVGIVGIVVPVLPGSATIAVAALVWAIVVGTGPGWSAFAAITVLVALGMAAGWVLTGRRLKERGIPNRSLLIGGVRGATVQVVATAMLAAYVGNGGLGRYIFQGLGSQNYPQMIAGSLLVIALALVLDLVLLLIQRLSTPRGLRAA